MVVLLSAAVLVLSILLRVTFDDAALAEERRVASVQLADELRQSSDDLTNLARLYAVTGDETYRDYFQQTLDIRSGDAPRPEGFGGVYWDFVLAGERSPDSSAAPAESFERKMFDLGFTQEDFSLLSEAERRSNTLAEVESEAFELVALGDEAAAIELLFGTEYLEAKAKIMEPIDEFQRTVASRTAETAAAKQDRRSSLQWWITGLSVLLVVFVAALLVAVTARPPSTSRDPASKGRSEIRLGLQARLLLGGLAVVLLSAALATVLFRIASDSIEAQAFDLLRSTREARAAAIESELRTIGNELDSLASSPGVRAAMVDFAAAFDERSANPAEGAAVGRVEAYYREDFVPRVVGNARPPEAYLPAGEPALVLQDDYIANNPFPVGDKNLLPTAGGDNAYDAAHEEYHEYFSRLLENTGFYDLFLINGDGDIVYTVFKEVDFATSLADGPHASSGLGIAWSSSSESAEPVTVDFAPYGPSYNQPAAFFAQGIYVDGTRVGTLALQAPVDDINSIMTNDERWESVGLGESGETYIVGADGTMRNDSRFLVEDPSGYFTAIEQAGVPPETVGAIEEFGSTVGLQEVDTVGVRAALAGEWGEQVFPDYRGVDVLSSYRPLQADGVDWVIMSEIDESEAFAAADRLLLVALITIGGGSLLIFGGIAVGSRRITGPLRRLDHAATDLASHDFANSGAVFPDDQGLSSVAERRDEIGDVARSFVKMRHDLGESVAATLSAVEAREAIEGELTVASEIQMAMLPLTFPAFPEHSEFQIHARLTPAKEVGGDFYEFGFVDDNHFFFCVGDVSGKGVPSALFMAAFKTLIRSGALQGEEPGPLFTRINSELSRENPEFMFSTVWLGVIDLRDGSIEFANGGHNPPLTVRDGVVAEIREIHGPLVGPIRGATWQQGTMRLREGETLVVFSDGVTEAMNPDEEQFGEARLSELLEAADPDPTAVTEQVVDQVTHWEAGHRSDDLTVLALRYLSARRVPHFELTLPSEGGGELSEAVANELSALNERLGSFAQDVGLPAEIIQALQISLDEILVNIASYSGASAITVRMWTEVSSATVEISDNGTPFNILGVEQPDTESALQDRAIGGLGVHLVRSLMDDVAYERVGDRNVVALTKSLPDEMKNGAKP